MVTLYSINCPKSGLVRYVGKTINRDERFRKHLSENNGTLKSKWVMGLRSQGLSPVFEIIEECLDSEWQEKERAYIRLYKSIGANLLNQMPGGEGGPTMKGRKLTADQRQKIADSKIGKANKGAADSNKVNKGKVVLQYDLGGNYIATHLTINDAAKSIGRSSRRIQKMVNGDRVNHVGGYRFVSQNEVK
jgi:hypothetical protein